MRDWQRVKETGSVWIFYLLSLLLKLCPHILLCLFAYPVSFFYYLIAKDARLAAKKYFTHLSAITGKRYSTYRLFLSFALTLVEKGEGWIGRCSYKDLHFAPDDITLFNEGLKEGQGAIAYVSHHGNSELLRALAEEIEREGIGTSIPVIALVDFDTTANFNHMLERLNASSMTQLMPIKELSPASIELLSQTIEKGGIIIVAGDRQGERNIDLPFLGESAQFPIGAFYLATLIGAPSYFIFCHRRKDCGFRKDFVVSVKRNDTAMGEDRRSRLAFASHSATTMAHLLEEACIAHPYQWYNFYDFWRQG